MRQQQRRRGQRDRQLAGNGAGAVAVTGADAPPDAPAPATAGQLPGGARAGFAAAATRVDGRAAAEPSHAHARLVEPAERRDAQVARARHDGREALLVRERASQQRDAQRRRRAGELAGHRPRPRRRTDTGTSTGTAAVLGTQRGRRRRAAAARAVRAHVAVADALVRPEALVVVEPRRARGRLRAAQLGHFVVQPGHQRRRRGQRARRPPQPAHAARPVLHLRRPRHW